MTLVRKAKRVSLWELLGLFALFLVLNWPGPVAAQNVFSTQEADIYYANPTDLQILESRLRFSRVDNFYPKYVSTSAAGQAVFSTGVAAKVDGLLAKVRLILNFCPRNQERLRIFLLKNGREVQQRRLALQPSAARPLFGHSTLEAFYDPMSRTIFLSLDDLRAGILAHEMTHFILCECVAVPPPEDIQEDWARYVETQVN
ncbi:MAG: hypothetical protein PHU44_16730 [Syntrophales bacterium]|nr:hypothetical protein [Syntrophales bacterium]